MQQFQLQKGRRGKGSVTKTDRERGKKGVRQMEKTWHGFGRSTLGLRLEAYELETSMGYLARLCNKITNLQTSEKARKALVGMGAGFRVFDLVVQIWQK